jgi:hypothetical protein
VVHVRTSIQFNVRVVSLITFFSAGWRSCGGTP